MILWKCVGPDRRAAIAAALVGAIGLTGCAEPEEPPAAPLDQVVAGMSVLRHESGSEFARLVVTPETLDGVVGRDGETYIRSLAPETRDEVKVSMRVATVPFKDIHPLSIHNDVRDLASRCEQYFSVRVEASGPGGLIYTLTCAADENSLTGVPPTAVRLNGHPVRELSGSWTAEDWDTILYELTHLAPSGKIEKLSITSSDQVMVRLAVADSSHNCQPEVVRELDGRGVSVVCWITPSTQPSFDYTALTGESIRAAAVRASTEGGFVLNSHVTYDLTLQDGGPSLSARGRGGAATVPLDS